MSFVVTHLDNTTNKRKQGYPEVITCLPEADIQFEGVKAWILQANTRQLVFFEFEADAKVPEHSHGYAQWGMVIDGKMELTINDKPQSAKLAGAIFMVRDISVVLAPLPFRERR